MISAGSGAPLHMHEILADAIRQEAEKRIRIREQRLREAHDYRIRFAKRTGQTPKMPPALSMPPTWGLHKHYQPEYCIKHRNFIAKGIWNALGNKTYTPVPSVELHLPKADGGLRTVHQFSIPDAAVSAMLAWRMIQRNETLFSSSSYAYRRTRRALDAVQHLREVVTQGRVYLVQCDFSGYFDSIDHSYLLARLGSGDFLIRPRERALVEAILTHRFATVANYPTQLWATRTRGIPQGLTISLFLANAAAHQLDRTLDRLGGVAFRFADDIVLATSYYQDAVAAYDAVVQHAERSGTALNVQKTRGICMLSAQPAEIRTVPQFDFLGYGFTTSGVCLAPRTVTRIKAHLAKTIYRHLLLYPRKGQFNASRIGPGFVDWDLVTCINEIRRYLYGGVSEALLQQHISGTLGLRTAGRGPMAYYCLTEDRSELHALDGWLVDAIRRAFRSRVRVLQSLGHVPAVTSLTKAEVVTGSWYSHPSIANETAMPSFYRAWLSGRKAWHTDGGAQIKMPPEAYVP